MANTAAPPPPSLFDSLRMQALVFEELRRIQRLVLERGIPQVPPPGPGQEQGAVEGELAQVLRNLQVVLLQHPLPAQAAFAALVAEGRRFAKTPEGATWKATLAGSELVRNGRQLWEVLSLNLLEEEPSTVVPSTYLEAVFQAASSPDLEALLRRLREAEPGEPHGTP